MTPDGQKTELLRKHALMKKLLEKETFTEDEMKNYVWLLRSSLRVLDQRLVESDG